MFNLLFFLFTFLANFNIYAQGSCCSIANICNSVTNISNLNSASIINIKYSPTNCLFALAKQGADQGNGNLLSSVSNNNCIGDCSISEPVSTVLEDPTPTNFVISNDGTCLAVLNSPENRISLYTVNNNCNLVKNSENDDLGGVPAGIIFSKNNSCLFVTVPGLAMNNILSFPVTSDSSGCILGDPVSYSLTSVQQLVVSNSGLCLIASNTSGVTSYAINEQNCSLTLTNSVPIDNIVSNVMALSSQNCLVVLSSTGRPPEVSYKLNFIKLNENCMLSDVIPSIDILTALVLQSATFSPDGSCLVLVFKEESNLRGEIQFFSINDCQPTFLGSKSFSNFGPTSVAYSPNGKCFAVGGFNSQPIIGSNGFIQTFSFVIACGSLSINTSTCGSVTISSNCVTPGAQITITENSRTLGTATATNSGTFTKTINNLTGGFHTFTVTATDAATNCSNSINISGTVTPCPRPKPPLIIGGSNFNNFSLVDPTCTKCYVAGRFTIGPVDLYSNLGGDVVNTTGCDFSVQKLNSNNSDLCAYAVNLNIPFCRRLVPFVFATDSNLVITQSSNQNFIVELPSESCQNGATISFIAVPST